MIRSIQDAILRSSDGHRRARHRLGSLVDNARLRDGRGITRGSRVFLLALTFLAISSCPAGAQTPAPRSFSGVLRDRDGTPVPNQLVRLLNANNDQVAVSTTSADGSFSISVSPGPYRLGVRGGSTVPANIPKGFDLFGPNIDLTSGRVQDLTLRNVFLDVTVLDPNGDPVRDAIVQVPCTSTSFELFPGGSTGGGVCTEGTTNDSGLVRLALFPATASVVVTPPAGSGLPQTSVSNVSVLEDSSVTVQLTLPVTFSGVLRDRDGTPVPDQLVRLLNANFDEVAVSTTSDDGSF